MNSIELISEISKRLDNLNLINSEFYTNCKRIVDDESRDPEEQRRALLTVIRQALIKLIDEVKESNK